MSCHSYRITIDADGQGWIERPGKETLGPYPRKEVAERVLGWLQSGQLPEAVADICQQARETA